MKLLRILFNIAISLATLSAFSQNAYEVQGEGQFRLKQGSVAKDIKLSVSNGEIKANGISFDPSLFCPATGKDPRISPDGTVSVTDGDKNVEVGQVFLVRPAQTVGEKAKIGNPGEPGFGLIVKSRKTETLPLKSEIRGTLVVPSGKVATIQIRAVTEVNTPNISLAQIADFGGSPEWISKLQSVSIGATPMIGSDRILTAVTIQSALRTARIPMDSIEIVVPSLAKVRRESRTITPLEIEGFGRDWIAQNMPAVGAVSLVNKPAERKVATGELNVSVTTPRDTGKSIILTMTCKIGEEIQFTQQLVFNKGVAAATPNIKSGATVQVRLVSGGISIEVTGQVKAVSGDSITVYIPETKATLVGKLCADGTIEVKL